MEETKVIYEMHELIKKPFTLHPNYKKSYPPSKRICAMCGRTLNMNSLMLVHSKGIGKHIWVCKKGWIKPDGQCQDLNNEVVK